MKQSLFILLCLFFVRPGKAQYSDSIFYHVGYASSGNYNRTDVSRSFLLSNAVNLNYRKKPLNINFSNKWLYGRQQGIQVNNDFSSLLDVNLYKTFKHFYYWGLFNYTRSYSLRVNHQLQAGLGVAYNLLDKTNFKINLSEGLLYDYSDLILKDGSREIYETPRNSFRFQVKYYYTTRFAFSGAFYVQHSLEYGNDVIYKGDADVTVKLLKWLSLTSKLTYNKFERTGRENLFITYGLTVEKYF